MVHFGYVMNTPLCWKRMWQPTQRGLHITYILTWTLGIVREDLGCFNSNSRITKLWTCISYANYYRHPKSVSQITISEKDSNEYVPISVVVLVALFGSTFSHAGGWPIPALWLSCALEWQAFKHLLCWPDNIQKHFEICEDAILCNMKHFEIHTELLCNMR